MFNLELSGQLTPCEYAHYLAEAMARGNRALSFAMDNIARNADDQADATMYALTKEYAGGCIFGAGQGAVVGGIVGEGAGAIPGALWGCAQSLLASDVSHFFSEALGTTIDYYGDWTDINELLKYLKEVPK